MSKKLIMIIAGISIFLNIFILGAIGGHFMRHAHNGGPFDMGGKKHMLQGPGMKGNGEIHMLRALMKVLPEEKQLAARQIFEKRRTEMRGHRKEMRTMQKDMITALTTEPFNRGQFEALMASQHAKNHELRIITQTEFLNFLETLNLAERQLLADVLQKRMKKHKRKHKPEE